MNLYLTSNDIEKRIAEGFAPDDLPARGVLQDWLKLSSSKMTMPELTANLKTGQAFIFAEGGIMLEWRKSDG